MRESIGAALRELKSRGVPAEMGQTLLDKLCIELVFTAHPTEAKRRTMLNKLQRLAQRLHNPASLIEDEITGVAVRADQVAEEFHRLLLGVGAPWVPDAEAPEVED